MRSQLRSMACMRPSAAGNMIRWESENKNMEVLIILKVKIKSENKSKVKIKSENNYQSENK